MKFGSKVWYCKRLSEPDENGEEFSKPIEIRTRPRYFTVMAKSGFSDIMEFGEKISSFLTAVAQPYNTWESSFSVGDLFYCNGEMPSEDEHYYGQNANYVVHSINYGNQIIKMTLKKVVD